jgi:hypothetical protein
MRAIALLTATLALLTGATAQAKGGAVAAVEVCDVTGCRPAEPTPELAHLLPAVYAAVTEGDRHVDASPHTPSLRIRLSLDDPDGRRLFDSGGAASTGPVEVDYAPSIQAVRLIAPHSKRHWARIDGPALTALDALRRGLVPRAGEAKWHGATQPSDRRGRDPDEAGPGGKPLAAVAVALAALALGAIVVRRRVRVPAVENDAGGVVG